MEGGRLHQRGNRGEARPRGSHCGAQAGPHPPPLGEGADDMSVPRSSVLERIDQICDQYEVARLAGQRPRIDDYLHEVPEAERAELLHELLRLERDYLQSDQRHRWQRGERVLVQSYLEQTPSLRDYPELVFELVCSEVLLREERGEKPRPVDYLELLPTYQTHLRRFFAARQLLTPETFQGLSDRA